MIASKKQMEQIGWMVQFVLDEVMICTAEPITEADFRERLEAAQASIKSKIGEILPDGEPFTEAEANRVNDSFAWFPITGRYLRVSNGEPEWVEWQHERDG